jgi:hypothetical protein
LCQHGKDNLLGHNNEEKCCELCSAQFILM